MAQSWPERLWLVRHGQSQGNVARDAADESGAHEIDIQMRDVDVPLSDLGLKQAEAAGRYFAALPADERPEIILCSPYVRARQTAELICKAGALAGGPARTIIDERLREREFGIFDRLTTAGIRARFPEEAAHRKRLGKFYHRPPGGESWADVILRLRSMLNTINLQYCDRRVLVVCHQVVVLCFRYILDRPRRGRDPRHRPSGGNPQLRHLRLRLRQVGRTACACRCSRNGTTERSSTSRARPRRRLQTRWREPGEPRHPARPVCPRYKSAACSHRRRQGNQGPHPHHCRQPRGPGSRLARGDRAPCAPAPASSRSRPSTASHRTSASQCRKRWSSECRKRMAALQAPLSNRSPDWRAASMRSSPDPAWRRETSVAASRRPCSGPTRRSLSTPPCCTRWSRQETSAATARRCCSPMPASSPRCSTATRKRSSAIRSAAAFARPGSTGRSCW